MNCKINWVKFNSAIGTMLGSVVYNFHKKIKGIKTKKNIAYSLPKNRFNKLDVYYPLDTNCVYNNKNKKNIYPAIIIYHGGGWACFSKNLYATMARRFSKMGFVVFACNYTLAPKAKMQKIEDDCLTAFDFIRQNSSNFGIDPNKIVLVGDSAGGHICAELMAKFSIEKNENKQRFNSVKALGLFYGVYNLQTVIKTKFPSIRTYVDACIEGGIKNTDDLIKFSPINKNLSSFPPCFLASGHIDKLHNSQSKAMANELKEQGVIVKTKFFKKDEKRAMHAFMSFDGLFTNVETLACFEKFLNQYVKGEK